MDRNIPANRGDHMHRVARISQIKAGYNLAITIILVLFSYDKNLIDPEAH